MRLGGPVFGDTSTPENWIAGLRRHGYRAAYCPLDNKADDATVRAYADAARDADIVIAEVGAWSNPLSPDESARRDAIAFNKAQLALADRIGARCCVNITGARGSQWDGPYADNYAVDTFDLIVETVREIIDAVQPTRTFYTLEMMPWALPDSPDTYLALMQAIDRERLAVHLDIANITCSPRQFYFNAALIEECFAKLGPSIKSCHAKDVVLGGTMTTHLQETRPGLGELDYPVLLRELEALDPDMPLMLEHLPDETEYALAAEHIRALCRVTNVSC